MSEQWNMMPDTVARPSVSEHEKWFFSAPTARAVRKRHVARQVHGHGDLLAEGRERVQLRDAFQRELAELNARVDVHERMEGPLWQLVQVGGKAPLELGQVGRRAASRPRPPRGLRTA